MSTPYFVPFTQSAEFNDVKASMKPVYADMDAAFLKYRLYELSDYVDCDGERQLTICNLWRIVRYPDSSVKTFEFSIKDDAWHEVTSLHQWPDVPFFNLKYFKYGLAWWREIIVMAIFKVMIELPEIRIKHNKNNPPAKMDATDIGHLINHDCHEFSSYYMNRQTPKSAALNCRIMMQKAGRLRGDFCKYIQDKEVLSCMLAINHGVSMLAINHGVTTLDRYLYLARHRAGLLKVAREHRNLLPLLLAIHPTCWHRDDLFSRKLWVKDGRKTTPLDRFPKPATRYFILDESAIKIASFNDPALWRYLLKAPNTVIKQWANFPHPVLMTNLMKANITVKAPVAAYIVLFNLQFFMIEHGVRTDIQRLYRLFLTEAARIWEADGYKKVREWLLRSRRQFINVHDYLKHEGFAQGQPTKQATWKSLLIRSSDWHERIALENLEKTPDYDWPMLFGPAVIDGITFTPITNSVVMAKEGYALNHCVGSYAPDCYEQFYYVYSVKEPDGTRSTLGLQLHLSDGSIYWHQHQSYCNQPASSAAEKAGMTLVKQLMATTGDIRVMPDNMDFKFLRDQHERMAAY